jgi:hypothetical protein
LAVVALEDEPTVEDFRRVYAAIREAIGRGSSSSLASNDVGEPGGRERPPPRNEDRENCKGR